MEHMMAVEKLDKPKGRSHYACMNTECMQLSLP
jgi:hypothetical protein